MLEAGEEFSAFCWSFIGEKPLVNDGRDRPTKTPLSERISKELKRRGFKYCGPTIVYAWMQATGMVNDHDAGCFRRQQLIETDWRSEEHTSELQSLMRISYDVFCVKKKKQTTSGSLDIKKPTT